MECTAERLTTGTWVRRAHRDAALRGSFRQVQWLRRTIRQRRTGHADLVIAVGLVGQLDPVYCDPSELWEVEQ
jgi:hypothetical protein